MLVVGSVGGVSAGLSHSLLVKTDGTAWAAGRNLYGELGDASTTQRTSFVQMSGVSGAVQVAGGGRHTLVLLSDGSVKAVGYNGSGQLGDNSTTNRSTAVSVSGASSITGLSAGYDHSLARKSDGTVWAWGYNYYGQLGEGTNTARSVAIQTSSLADISAIGTGRHHSLAVSSTGVVYSWGHNSDSQLGDGTTIERATPAAISDTGFAWKVGTPVFSVAGGTYTTDRTVVVTVATSSVSIHYTLDGSEPTESDATITSGSSLAITQTRTLKAKAWKSGLSPSHVQTAVYTMKVATPSVSPNGGSHASAQNVTMTSATPGSTLRYTTDGTEPTDTSTAYAGAITIGTSTTLKVVGFKANWSQSDTRTATFTMNFGTLAAPTVTPATGTYESSVSVTMSSAQSGAVVRYTTNGATPSASSTLYTAPLTLEATTTIKAKAFHPDYTTSSEAARTYTIAVAAPSFTPTAGAYTAGQTVTVTGTTPGATIRYTLNGADPLETDPVIASGGTLVLGNYTLKAKAFKTGASPSSVASAAYTVTGNVTSARIDGGYSHTTALRSDGVLWGWGSAGSGQLGIGSVSGSQLLPRLAPGLSGITQVAASDYYSLVVHSGGAVSAFGTNSSGQLGEGTTTTRMWPTSVTGLSTVTAVAAGETHALALKADGTVAAWGANNTGQIGDGTTTQRLTPTAVGTLTNITAVEAGDRFSLALAQSGTVYSWGFNSAGRLGDGSTTTRTSPVSVSGISSAVAISAGMAHGLAILSDGTLRAWGYNYLGQLGDGSTTDRSTPIEVPGVTNAIAIAAGVYHSIALTATGEVWTWGGNGRGQLGDGTNTDRSTPAQVSSLSGIVAIAAGSYHGVAIGEDGTVWVWGKNDAAQLGDGTTIDRETPVPISGPNMQWRVPTPLISLAGGLYSAAQTATITIPDAEATLRYTLDGNDPSPSSQSIVSGGSIAIDVSGTLKVSGWKTGSLESLVVTRAYELKAVKPVITPNPGAYSSAPTATMSTTTPGATVRYTFDGTEPTSSSPAYSSGLSITETGTLKARAFKTGWTSSDSAAHSYSVSSGTVATPTILPVGGALSSPPFISIGTATGGATIRFTLDGSTPGPHSARYLHPFEVTATTTVKAQAYKPGMTSSAVTTVSYALDASGAVATPTIAPAGGIFATSRVVTITGPSGATLRYTVTGIDPTETDTAITSGNTITVSSSQVVKVRAFETGLEPSAVRRADFMITGAISAGEDHSAALAANGDLYTWGYNGWRQVGNGSSTDQLTPYLVLTGVQAVSAGAQHTLALKADGSVWAWGNAVDGRIGTGSTSGYQATPIQVTALSGVIAIAAGRHHSLAAKSDGTVWAWGRNDTGQLGDGTTTNRATPVQVVGLEGIAQLAAGDGYSLALQTSSAAGGLVWSWGKNNVGQLGDGSVLQRTTPVLVTGIGAATKVTAGVASALALLSDGTVFGWGTSVDAQLGLGELAQVPTPRRIAPLARVWSIAQGASHGLAFDRGGAGWSWGANAYAQGGIGSESGALLVPSGNDVKAALALAVGDEHSLLLHPEGTVRGFGLKFSGRLGNGTTSGFEAALTPVSGLTLVSNAWLVGDADNDGLATWREYLLGTDPLNPDTNGNGILDAHDEFGDGSAANSDVDGDGISNWAERLRGTDPFRADSDGDSVDDLADAFPLDPTRSSAPAPNPADTTPPVITLTEPTSARPVPPPPPN